MDSVFTKPKIISLFLFILTGYLSGFAQTKLDDVQTKKIAFKRIVEFLENQKAGEVVSFSDIQPSLDPDSSTAGFHVIDREYLVKDSLSKVWGYYANSDLQSSWNSNSVHMGLAYSRKNDSIYYSSDKLENLNIGLIVFFDIKLLMGLKEIAMAFEVTKVDPAERLIEYSYIKGNGTSGKQQMFFQSTPKGYTLITHLSYYKSKPKTREGIYPHLHAQLINRFHRNMKKTYKGKPTG